MPVVAVVFGEEKVAGGGAEAEAQTVVPRQTNSHALTCGKVRSGQLRSADSSSDVYPSTKARQYTVHLNVWLHG